MRKNKTKIFVAIFSVTLPILILSLYYCFYYSYEVVDEGDWRTEFYQKYYENPSDVNINLTEKDAVRIADRYLKDTTDRKYKVYFDKDNNWYYVGARYTETRYNWFNRYSEWEHMILIDKNTGAIRDLKVIAY